MCRSFDYPLIKRCLRIDRLKQIQMMVLVPWVGDPGGDVQSIAAHGAYGRINNEYAAEYTPKRK